MRRRRFRVAAALLATALAGCESMPSPGDTVTAQVLEVPRSRAALGGGFSSLHAALAAGVGRAEAERGRLWQAQCVEPAADAPEGLRPRTATLVLPDGVAAGAGALVALAELQAAHAEDRRRHGRFVAVLEPAAPEAAAARPGWQPYFGRLQPLCTAEGAPPQGWRVQLRVAVAPWEIDFAQAERQRHDALSDSDLAAGRVVRVACQLKVVDGGDWTRPSWLARVPEGLALREGEVVRLRAGAEEGGRRAAPLAEVLGPAPGVARAPGNAVVRCR